MKPSYLDNRMAGAFGTYKGYVAGCGGDVWWVEHEGGKVAAYMFNEVMVEGE